MQNNRARKILKKHVIEAFSKESEITAIYVFGKEVHGKTDQYSDIDMVICSNDLEKTQSRYMKIFKGISPVRGSFLLNSTERDLSQMIMLQGFSPYQKIDFSITDHIDRKRAAGFGPFVSVYQSDIPEFWKAESCRKLSDRHAIADFFRERKSTACTDRN